MAKDAKVQILFTLRYFLFSSVERYYIRFVTLYTRYFIYHDVYWSDIKGIVWLDNCTFLFINALRAHSGGVTKACPRSLFRQFFLHMRMIKKSHIYRVHQDIHYANVINQSNDCVHDVLPLLWLSSSSSSSSSLSPPSSYSLPST